MRTALLYAEGGFVGREYHHALARNGLAPDMLCAVGEFGQESVAREVARTGGMWRPAEIPETARPRRYDQLSDADLWRDLRAAEIELVIQGGVGVLTTDMLNAARLGFLNVHPGKLPQYRGSTCPEWAIAEKNDIFLTAHMIDDGLDSGPVLLERRFEWRGFASYEAMRAAIYPACADLLVSALVMLRDVEPGDLSRLLHPQDERLAQLRRPMPPETFEQVIAAFGGAGAVCGAVR